MLSWSVFEGQGDRPKFKLTVGKVAKVVGATSIEGFLHRIHEKGVTLLLPLTLPNDNRFFPKFTAKSVGERILKISHYLIQMEAKYTVSQKSSHLLTVCNFVKS